MLATSMSDLRGVTIFRGENFLSKMCVSLPFPRLLCVIRHRVSSYPPSFACVRVKVSVCGCGRRRLQLALEEVGS